MMKLVGDWEKAAKIVETMGKRFSAAAEQAILREGHYLRGLVVQNFTSGGQLAGKPFAPLSPSTLAIRKFTGFGGTKILMRTGALRNSVVVKKVGNAVFVGVMRKSGKGANVAEIHEFGAGPYQVVMTDRQRKFLMAALSSFGGAPSPGKGGGVLVIKIPARPFMAPVFDKFATPKDVKKRFWDHVSKAMGYDLGKP
jgi:phage gpG-like protein